MEHNAKELDETITQTKKNCIYNGKREGKSGRKNKSRTTKLNLNEIEANKRAKKREKRQQQKKNYYQFDNGLKPFC